MRKTLIAKNGKLLTDGTIYVKVVDLAEDRSEEEFHEITEEEYEEILKEQELSSEV